MDALLKTPAALRYRMPAEWEPHAATWLSWPRREGISFPDSFDRVLPVLRAMVEALIKSERVCINVCNGAHEAEARAALRGLSMERVTFIGFQQMSRGAAITGRFFSRAMPIRVSRLSIGITTPGAASIRRVITMMLCRHVRHNFSMSQFFIPE